MDPAPVTSSPDTRTFAFPRKFRWMVGGTAIGLGAISTFGLLFPHLEPEDGIWLVAALWIGLFGILTAATVPTVLILRDRVTVSPEGISLVRPGKPTEFVRWCEITKLRSRDGLQRLEIFDQEGRRRMKLEYQLENFEELDRIIRERAPSQREAAPKEDGRMKFRLGRPQRLIAVAGAIVGVVFVIAWMSDPWIAVGFGGFALFCLASSLWEPHLLEIQDDRIVLRSRIRKRPIPFCVLIDVRFEYSKGPYSSIIARIELHRLRGKPKYLGQFAGGAAPVYRHIRTRWEKWVVENRE